VAVQLATPEDGWRPIKPDASEVVRFTTTTVSPTAVTTAVTLQMKPETNAGASFGEGSDANPGTEVGAFSRGIRDGTV